MFRIQISHGRLVHLHVRALLHFVFETDHKRFQEHDGLPGPEHHLLPCNEHAVLPPENHLQPIVRQVIGEATDQEVRLQAGRGQPAFGHAGGRRRDHGRQRALRHAHVFGAHRFAPEKLAGLIVQLPESPPRCVSIVRVRRTRVPVRALRARLPDFPACAAAGSWGAAGGADAPRAAGKVAAARSPARTSNRSRAVAVAPRRAAHFVCRSSAAPTRRVSGATTCSPGGPLPRFAARTPPALAGRPFGFAARRWPSVLSSQTAPPKTSSKVFQKNSRAKFSNFRSRTMRGARRLSSPPRRATTARLAAPTGVWRWVRPHSGASETCRPPTAWPARIPRCRRSRAT